MKIIITGAAGYIGTKLVSELIKIDHEITCVDNLMFNQKNMSLMNNKKVNFIKGDVRDEKLMKELIAKNDLIIPLAAIVGAPLSAKMPLETEEINFAAIDFMCKNLSKDQRVIMPVTNSGYGIGKKDEMCDENSPLNPISAYGQTKVKAEKVIMERENSISFRLATVFGTSERMRVDLLVNNFTYIAVFKKYLKLYEPHFRRNYIHILDVVKGLIFGVSNFEKLKGNIFNLGLSEANLTKEQLCKTIQSEIPDFKYEVSLDGKDEDKRDYFVSNKKVEKMGFKAVHTLEEGIQELKNYYLSNKNISKNY
ncbi:NAD(P)-dependent oxidoreductase [Candidatus Pelagibacter sp.]|nr:NAD(P)-dependent oxidoreductase [Candidatus Pelagibacter sp.]